MPVLGHAGASGSVGGRLIEQGGEQLLKRLGYREVNFPHGVAAEADEQCPAIDLH